MVHICDIESIEGWKNHYVEEGKRFLDQEYGSDTDDVSLVKRKAAEAHLRIYIPKALQTKAAQLRKSDSHGLIVGFTTIAGAIPFGKWIVSAIGAGAFREKVMQEYGLEYDEPVFWLILQGMADAGVIQSKPHSLTSLLIDKAKEYARDKLDYAWNQGTLQDEVHDEVIHEFGKVLGDELFDEAASLVPIIGTVISCKMGEQKAIKKLYAIIESVQQVALRVHESIVVPVVLERLGLGLKQIQESEARKPVSVPKKPTQEDWERIRMHYMQPPSSITYQSTPRVTHPQHRERNQATQKANQTALATAASAEPTPNFIFITVFALFVCLLFSPQHLFKSSQDISTSYWGPIHLAVVLWSSFWRRTIWTGGNWRFYTKMVFVPIIFLLGELVLIAAIAYEVGYALGMFTTKILSTGIKDGKEREKRKKWN